MGKEKISIITITYNSQDTIRKTIESVISQKYRPLEYVLVDGGSSDKTNEIISSYFEEFKIRGIEYSFKSESDEGISDAFNKGIKRATGEIIGIINSDDQLETDILSTVSDNFDNDVDVLCGDCLWVDEEKKISYIRKSRLNLKKLKHEMVIMHPTCFVRKKSYELYGCFDKELKFCMDKDLMARFYRNGAHFKYIPFTISVMAAGGISDINYKQVFDEGVIIAERNGVPHFFAVTYRMYKILRLTLIRMIKQNDLEMKLK